MAHNGEYDVAVRALNELIRDAAGLLRDVINDSQTPWPIREEMIFRLIELTLKDSD